MVKSLGHSAQPGHVAVLDVGGGGVEQLYQSTQERQEAGPWNHTVISMGLRGKVKDRH